MIGRPAACAAILLALAMAPRGGAVAELRAEEITPANAEEVLIGGPDAVGGLGDYYLANDVVEVVVDHPRRRHGLLNHGGTLVDAGLRDRRGEDQLARISPLVNLSQRVFVGYDAIRAELAQDGAFARVVVTSSGMSSLPRGGGLARALDLLVPAPEELAPVRVETVYEVRPGESFVRLRTRFENRGDATAPVFAYGDLWMRGGRGMRAFLGNALAPELARGFRHRSFSAAAILGSMEAMAPFSHLVMSGVPGPPPVSYALFSPERSGRGLSFFGVSGAHVSLASVFREDPGWPELGYLRLADALDGGLAPGESWEVQRRLLVTGGADVASATDVVLPALGIPADGGIEGSVAPAGLRSVVHVDDAAGRPVTQMLATAGRYHAQLAPGVYRLTYRAPHRPPVVREARVEAGGLTRLPDLRWPEVGALRLDPAFADGGPGRIVFVGIEGTATPVFGAELLDARLDGELLPSPTRRNDLSFVGGESDPREVALPFGRYRLVATRGPEWDVAERSVELGPGEPVVRVPAFALSRVASLPGHVAADLHVHAQASDDSATSNEDRLRDFVAAGIGWLVATDHENVARYDEALAATGLEGRIRVIHGVEVTSSAPSEAAPWTLGHQNAWPVAQRSFEHRNGAPPSQDVPAGELFSRLRREWGAQVVQLNHPRGETLERDDGYFFSHQGSAGRPVDTSLPLTAPEHAALLEAAADGTRAVDFDVIELMNGASRSQYRLVRDDFHWLLRQGLRRAATANSDTHGPDDPAGLPRNYVRVGEGAVGVRRVAQALRAGRSFGTNGPLVLDFRVAGARSGESVVATGGRCAVDYRVVSAPWVPMEEVRLVVNGEVVRRSTALSGRFDLALSRDAFVTLEAGAPLHVDPDAWREQHPGPYADVAPGHVPTAFTNPVYVDADGDGRWTPPGLPPRQPELAPAFHGAALAAAGAALWALRRRRA